MLPPFFCVFLDCHSRPMAPPPNDPRPPLVPFNGHPYLTNHLQVGLLAETLLEATAQDNAVTGAEVTRLREETRAAKRKLAQARRERALKAMGVRATGAGKSSAVSSTAVGTGGGDGEVSWWGMGRWLGTALVCWVWLCHAGWLAAVWRIHPFTGTDVGLCSRSWLLWSPSTM